MNKLLISGNGKHYKRKVGVGIFTIVFNISLAIVAFVGTSTIGTSYSVSRSFREIIGVIGPIAGVLMVGAVIYQCYVLALNIAASKTNISVCETSISGDGATSSFSVQSFNLPLEDVMNVDVIKNVAIVICSKHETYKCYTSNCAEIREVILKNKNI